MCFVFCSVGEGCASPFHCLMFIFTSAGAALGVQSSFSTTQSICPLSEFHVNFNLPGFCYDADQGLEPLMQVLKQKSPGATFGSMPESPCGYGERWLRWQEAQHKHVLLLGKVSRTFLRITQHICKHIGQGCLYKQWGSPHNVVLKCLWFKQD